MISHPHIKLCYQVRQRFWISRRLAVFKPVEVSREELTTSVVVRYRSADALEKRGDKMCILFLQACY